MRRPLGSVAQRAVFMRIPLTQGSLLSQFHSTLHTNLLAKHPLAASRRLAFLPIARIHAAQRQQQLVNVESVDICLDSQPNLERCFQVFHYIRKPIRIHYWVFPRKRLKLSMGLSVSLSVSLQIQNRWIVCVGWI